MPEEKLNDETQNTEPQVEEQTDDFVPGEEAPDFTEQLASLIVGTSDTEPDTETEEPAQEQEPGEAGEEEAAAAAAAVEEEDVLTEEEIERGIDSLLEEIEKGGDIPEDYKVAKQLYDTIASNPDAFSALLDALKPKEEKQEIQIPEPEIPDVPRPENFDPAEAFDPTTPSGKWYMAQVARSVSKSLMPVFGQIATKVSTVEQFINTIQQQEIQRQQQEQVSRVLADFVSRHPEAEPVAQDFVQFLNNPDGVTMDDMWEIYAKKRGLTAAQVHEIARKRQTPPEAPPASQVGGGNRMQKPKPKDMGEQISSFLAALAGEAEY